MRLKKVLYKQRENFLFEGFLEEVTLEQELDT